MSAHDMGSWIISLTFLATSGYLIYEDRSFKGLALAGCVATAMVLCFAGLLFTGVVTYSLAWLGDPIEHEVVLGLLVSLGVLVSLGIRRLWKNARR